MQFEADKWCWQQVVTAGCDSEENVYFELNIKNRQFRQIMIFATIILL